MKKTILLVVAMIMATTLCHARYTVQTKGQNLAQALGSLVTKYPQAPVNYIYDELDNYAAAADIDSDDLYTALRRMIGMNPVVVREKDRIFYVQPRQKGKAVYTMRLTDNAGNPVPGATVYLINPPGKDVVTFGVADDNGRVSIPCDRTDVDAKIVCVGYITHTVPSVPVNGGTIVLADDVQLLNTVQVTGADTRMTADKNIYLPTMRQKRSAQNAMALLRRMAIPQLVVNGNSVTDVAGQPVSLYIDNVPASKEQLQGLRPTDVVRVEFLENPSQAVYNGEQRVVNIVLRKLAWGGYTKLSAYEKTIAGYSGDANVFSRFVTGRMTYSLYAGAENSSTHTAGSTETQTFNLTNPVTRTQTLDEARKKTAEYPVTFRAQYSAKNFTAVNTLAYGHRSTPEDDTEGNVSITGTETDGYATSNTARSNIMSYNGSYYITLPRRWNMSLQPSFNHAHNDNRSLYVTDRTHIANFARENVYETYLRATASHKFDDTHSGFVTLYAGDMRNRVHYTGNNDDRDRFDFDFGTLWLGYNYRHKGISIAADAGLAVENTRYNAESSADVYPFAHLNASYGYNDHSRYSVYLQYASNTPDISEKTSTVRQANEFMYRTGNPALHQSRHFTCNLAYNYWHSNRFKMAAFAGVYDEHKLVVRTYSPYRDSQALLSGFANNGQYTRMFAGVNATVRFFDNSLQIYGNVALNSYRNRGYYHCTYNPVRIQLQADYYWRNFYFQAYWNNPDNKLTQTSNVLIKGRYNHGIEAGWGNGTFNASVTASNIFNRGRWHQHWLQDGGLYQSRLTTFNPNAGPRIAVSLTYTIGYGKEVRHQGEIGSQAGAGSAILK